MKDQCVLVFDVALGELHAKIVWGYPAIGAAKEDTEELLWHEQFVPDVGFEDFQVDGQVFPWVPRFPQVPVFTVIRFQDRLIWKQGGFAVIVTNGLLTFIAEIVSFELVSVPGAHALGDGIHEEVRCYDIPLAGQGFGEEPHDTRVWGRVRFWAAPFAFDMDLYLSGPLIHQQDLGGEE